MRRIPTGRRRAAAPALALLALLLGAACATRAPLERDWVRVRTPHLEIVSAASERRTLDLAHDLEVFRSVVEASTTMKETVPRLPTRVYVLDPATWDALALDGFAGFFLPGIRQNTLVMRRQAWEGDLRAVLLHEYVHFLAENQSSQRAPLWFEEGWADLLGAARIGKNVVTIGALPPGRSYWLLQPGWLDTRQVLAAREYPADDEARARFYAQSLALVHYLQLGRGSYDGFRGQMADYLERLQRGEPIEGAFAEAFGLAPGSVEAVLRAYLQRGVAGLRIPRERLAEPPPLRAMTLRGAALARSLGELLLQADQPGRARGLFARALQADPGNARARCGLGTALGRLGEWSEAETQLARCLALTPEDALAHLDWANHRLARAAAEPDAAQRARWVEEAREHYAESLRLEPALPEAQVQLGSSYLVRGEDAAQALAPLESAHARLPSSQAIRIRLALAYARVGRGVEARELLARAGAVGGHLGPDRESTRELLEELDRELSPPGGAPLTPRPHTPAPPRSREREE